MKLRDLSPYTRRAIELTHGRVDGTTDHVPTWDGTTLHIHRIKNEPNVLHEVAHWIVAPEEDRSLPNYGLGTDPDNGPEVVAKWLTSVGKFRQLTRTRGLTAEQAIAIAQGNADTILDLSEAATAHEEALAAFVTIILMRLAGLKWADHMRKVFDREDKREAFWPYLYELSARGVDVDDPLRPFARHS